MRILADENFPREIVEAFRTGGHDVLWARRDCIGWKDTALLNLAESDSRILLTFDKDFQQLALQRRVPLKRSGVVLFRVHPATTQTLNPLVRMFLELPDTGTGRISLITPGGIQMIPPRRK